MAFATKQTGSYQSAKSHRETHCTAHQWLVGENCNQEVSTPFATNVSASGTKPTKPRPRLNVEQLTPKRASPKRHGGFVWPARIEIDQPAGAHILEVVEASIEGAAGDLTVMLAVFEPGGCVMAALSIS